jgi:hypothetical protein
MTGIIWHDLDRCWFLHKQQCEFHMRYYKAVAAILVTVMNAFLSCVKINSKCLFTSIKVA